MWRVGSAQHQLVLVQKVHQAGIAFHELYHERNNTSQNLREAHVANHKTADLLKQRQLILTALQARFQFPDL